MSSVHTEITSRLNTLTDTPDLDASVLLAHILKKPRTWVMAHPELTLNEDQQDQLEASLVRLERGESFPYVLGHWEFFGLDLEVTPDVLIPRPETELLVERAIAWLQESPERKSVADIGTGSGAIAVSLAVNVSYINIMATDISPKALQIAKQNAMKHNVEHKIKFIECDLLPTESSIANRKSQLVNRKSKIDLLCANLPYIPTDTLHRLPIYGREPTLALDGGNDGLESIRKLLEMAPEWLASNSLILLEIETTRGAQAIGLAHDYFLQSKIHLHQDLTGRDRLLEIQL